MKIVVSHPGQQHSYRLASALSSEGQLLAYVTTVYDRPRSFTHAVSKFLTGKDRAKAKARHCEQIPDDLVVQFCELGGLFKLFLLRFRCLRPMYRFVKYLTTDCFANRAAKYAVRHGADVVIGYDDCSSRLFNLLVGEVPSVVRVLDVSAAFVPYMRHIYEIDCELKPQFSQRLKSERAIAWDEKTLERCAEELKNANYCIAPSHFVARTLEWAGFPKSHIYICHYGVDAERFSERVYPSTEEVCRRPLRVIYVGGVKELKGVSYLLEAFLHIPSTQAVLTVVGQANTEDDDIQPYMGRVYFTGSVLHTVVPSLLHESDVFVMPSLGEGMSLSSLEAAACGLPLIVSENSGIDDILQDGREGFVIPIQSSKAIEEKIVWFAEHPESLEAMGKAARRMAMNYSWESYGDRVREIFKQIQEDTLGAQ